MTFFLHKLYMFNSEEPQTSVGPTGPFSEETFEQLHLHSSSVGPGRRTEYTDEVSQSCNVSGFHPQAPSGCCGTVLCPLQHVLGTSMGVYVSAAGPEKQCCPSFQQARTPNTSRRTLGPRKLFIVSGCFENPAARFQICAGGTHLAAKLLCA